MKTVLEKIEIKGYDRGLCQQIKAGWDSVAKPLDSMGVFEGTLARIGAIQGTTHPRIGKSRILVCCADNGVVAEGVSQCGQEITAICAENIANGRSSVAIMAKQAGVEVKAVDVGIATDALLNNVMFRKVRKGTRDFLREPAMTLEETEGAVRIGMELVRESKEEGMEILGIGEMGIGNTTTSSAVTAALLGLPVETVTGRGAGLDDHGLSRKREVIQLALQKYGVMHDPMDILSKVGGLDIACMAGICLGGAIYNVPIVLDGFVSLAAALVACRMEPIVKEFLIPSHSGKEPAMKVIEEELSLTPVIYAGMALGEGTGAVLMLQLLKTVNAVYENSCSFEDAGIKKYERYGGS